MFLRVHCSGLVVDAIVVFFVVVVVGDGGGGGGARLYPPVHVQFTCSVQISLSIYTVYF